MADIIQVLAVSTVNRMNSSSRGSVSRKERRHNPLSEDIAATGPLRSKPPKRKAKQLRDEDDKYVDSRSTQKILKIGQDLLENDKEESGVFSPNRAFSFESRFGQDDRLDFQDKDDEDWGDEEVDEIEDVVCSKINTLQSSWKLIS